MRSAFGSLTDGRRLSDQLSKPAPPSDGLWELELAAGDARVTRAGYQPAKAAEWGGREASAPNEHPFAQWQAGKSRSPLRCRDKDCGSSFGNRMSRSHSPAGRGEDGGYTQNRNETGGEGRGRVRRADPQHLLSMQQHFLSGRRAIVQLLSIPGHGARG